MQIKTLTTLQYNNDTRGPWRLYIYGRDGYHSGGQWFTAVIKYPQEEITIEDAARRADVAIQKGLEVRITDWGDMLVFHSQNGRQLYPSPSVDFWNSIRGADR